MAALRRLGHRRLASVSKPDWPVYLQLDIEERPCQRSDNIDIRPEPFALGQV